MYKMPEKQTDNTITSFQGRSLLQQLWSCEDSCKVCARMCVVHIRVNVLRDVDVHTCGDQTLTRLFTLLFGTGSLTGAR